MMNSWDFNNMNGTQGVCANWNKSGGERQILNVFLCGWQKETKQAKQNKNKHLDSDRAEVMMGVGRWSQRVGWRGSSCGRGLLVFCWWAWCKIHLEEYEPVLKNSECCKDCYLKQTNNQPEKKKKIQQLWNRLQF